MKVPVYHEPTLELIGVVDIDSVQQELLEQQRCLRTARWPEIRSPLGLSGLVVESDLWVERIEFRYFPLKNAHGARTIALTVAKKEWLSGWDRQLWPRKRKKNFRLTKAERKARREQRVSYSTPRLHGTVVDT